MTSAGLDKKGRYIDNTSLINSPHNPKVGGSNPPPATNDMGCCLPNKIEAFFGIDFNWLDFGVLVNLELEGVTLRYTLRKPFDLMVDCSTRSEWLGREDSNLYNWRQRPGSYH